jgi:4-aminobutyrate aminotransferase
VGCGRQSIPGLAAGIAVTLPVSHPKVVKSIQKQAEKFIHISADFYHPLWVETGKN